MANILDVAKKAGVSRSTVSRVLTNSKRVDPKTREKVLQAVKELRYQPSRFAQALRNKKTKLIAVLVPRISNMIFAELMQGIEREAAKHQFNVLLCNTEYDPAKELHYLQMLQNGQVDGVIMTAFHNEISLIHEFREFGPIVLAGEYIEEHLYPTVAIDHQKAAYQAAAHLIKLGHKSIGMVNGSLTSMIPRARERGFRQALNDNGVKVEEKWIKALSFGINWGRDYVRMLLENGTLPTAVFASNDELAVGVIQEAKEQGIRVPEDLAVVGFDDQPIATIIEPKLTTIQQPIRDLGSMAFALMIQFLENAAIDRKILETKLVVRQSCGAYKK